MNQNIEDKIMNNKSIESNAKTALNMYKMEISSELNNFSSDQYGSPYLGGLATRQLVEMGEKELLKQYSNKNNS